MFSESVAVNRGFTDEMFTLDAKLKLLPADK
jgi:hypothetical protein